MKLHKISALAVLTTLSLTGCGSGGSTATSGYTLTSASLVLGQPDFVSYLANEGGVADAMTLNQPIGDAAFDVTNHAMFVVDTGDNRLLRFSPTPTANNASANAAFGVLGQADFTSSEPNYSGASPDGPGITQYGVAKPGKIWISGSYVVVTDTANNRVLVYDAVPTMPNPQPIAILGQQTAGTGAAVSPSLCTASTLNNPTAAIAVQGPSGLELLVVDQGDNRVLIWNFGSTKPTTGAAANVVLGQSTMTSCSSPTPYGTVAETASSLDGPTDVWSDGYDLLISDTLDDRLMYWPQIPTTNGTSAEYPLGQIEFTGSSTAVTAYTLDQPTGITATPNGSQIFVADTGNNRVMIFDGFPASYGESASFVLGQENFIYNSPNDDNGNSVNPQSNPGKQANNSNAPTQRTLNSPDGVAYNSADGSLWVTDHGNNRLVQFSKTALTTSEVVN